jgi:hypothetical protein
MGLRVHDGGAEDADGTPVKVTLEVNAHPPASVLIALPFAALSYSNATLVWNLLSLAALAISLWLIARALNFEFTAWSIFPVVALLLLCSPFREQISQGQLNLVLLLLITAAWVASRTRYDAMAGLMLGLATAVKLFPGFLFLYFVIQRRWKVVWSGIAAFLGVTALTVAVFGSDTFAAYVYDVLPKVKDFRSSWVNASIIGLFAKLFNPATDIERVVPLLRSPLTARLASAFACAGILALWAPIVWRAKNQREKDLAYGLTICTMLLISPITWDHYFLLLLVPLAILWVRLPKSAGARSAFLLVVLLLCLPPASLWNAVIPGGRAGIARPAHSITVLAYGTYALIAVLAYTVVMARYASTAKNVGTARS